MDAYDFIKSDLLRRKYRRWKMFGIYSGILLSLLLVLQTSFVASPLQKVGFLFLLIAGLALSLGVPMVSRKKLNMASVLAIASLFTLVFMGVDIDEKIHHPILQPGIKCSVVGSLGAVLAFAAMHVFAGDYWRRYPSSAGILAVSVMCVGLSYLLGRCLIGDSLHNLVFHFLPVVILYFLIQQVIRLHYHDSSSTSQ